MKYSKLNFIISLLILSLIIYSCKNASPEAEKNHAESGISGELIIFHAGSLSVPFKEIAKNFNEEYPEVNILMESAGSRQCARKITDLKKKCDIMASADYTVIDKLLIPEYTDWNIKFASNEMAIVFHEDSKYSEEIKEDNWFEILLKEDVIFGRAEPDSDPCGYRAVLTVKLAEIYYNKQRLAQNFLSKDLNYIRPKEVDLLGLLEVNAIDYIFLYRSVAEQHKLSYLILPDEINLKNPGLSDFYSKVTIDISGKEPGEKITKKGEPMVYGVTILKNAPNKDIARLFVSFLLEKEKGMAIMEQNGQPSLVPTKSDTYDNIPDQFKKFALNN